MTVFPGQEIRINGQLLDALDKDDILFDDTAGKYIMLEIPDDDVLQKGCLSQITASSYVGTFGKKVENFNRQLIESGQGYIFASDAHDLPGRKYEMRQAFEKLRHEFGSGLVERYQQNARLIINGVVCKIKLEKIKSHL